MHAGIIFLLVIVGSILFHIFTPWYWTDIASNWQGMDDTITLTFWVGGGVFVAVCLFMVYCVFKFSYKEGRTVEYKPEDKKLERILTWATTLGVAALLAPGLIIWNQYVNVPKNALEVDVMAWQWGWQYRLPGEDGKLGTTKVININDDKSSWKRKIGYVPQNIFLIDDSIKNNIAFGIEGDKIDELKLNKAIEESQLKSFINSLEIGFETKVGERGAQISGGQLQRIGIVRALYNDPEILILDESTASLDTLTENGIMDSINKLKGEKTIIMISHRFSSLKDCDKIYEIRDGKILGEINKFKKHA